MRLGNAKLTATTQHFLDTCDAVKSWTPNAAETECTFVYDETAEVAIVPDGVEFSDDEFRDVNAAPTQNKMKTNPILTPRQLANRLRAATTYAERYIAASTIIAHRNVAVGNIPLGLVAKAESILEAHAKPLRFETCEVRWIGDGSIPAGEHPFKHVNKRGDH